jgi:OTU domain-containing protein 3
LVFYLGNCLFNALSDQIYGNQARHAEIRMGVIRYMRENPEKFKPFLTVGGGQRRNPKRKNAGAFSSRFAFTVATEEETNAAYEAHLTQMAQGGTWGDNIEIIAFSYAYNTDVKIYKASHAYYVRVSAENNVRPVAHIAYHVSVSFPCFEASFKAYQLTCIFC